MEGRRLKIRNLQSEIRGEPLKRFFCIILAILILLFILPDICLALEPDEILVVANRNAAKSVGLAKYYMEKRKIPEKNLIKLWVTDKEECSRVDYEKKVVAPVRRYLEKVNPRWSIRCLVIMYGMPLKVASPELTIKEEN
ncbi:MAG: TIGR03790 family protein, partial [Proteobacteria bacterium]|nr:TIGR03790 family protein [Pseudomonadota bacterium]